MDRNTEAAAALAAVHGLWRALATGDDELVRHLVVPGMLARLADYTVGPAERLRAAMGASRQECGTMLCSSRVRLLRAEDAYLVISTRPRGMASVEVLGANGPELLSRAWPMIVVRLVNELRVWGGPSGEDWQEVAGYSDVSVELRPERVE